MRILIFLTTCLFAAHSVAADNESVVARLLNGSTYDVLDAGSEEPVLLKFWATWCVACLQEMPAYVELHEKYGERVRFLAVNVAVSDPRDRVASTVDQYELSMPVAYDESGDLWNRYDIIGTPTYVLLAAMAQSSTARTGTTVALNRPSIRQ